MHEFDSLNTTDPSAPTTSEMDAMWRDHHAAELAEAARYERLRRIAQAPILERALADEALYGEAA